MPRFSRKKDITLVVLVLFVGISIAGYLFTNMERQKALPPLSIGEQVPLGIVQTLDGKDVSTYSFIVNKSVVIFFAAGCSHCTSEITDIVSLYLTDKDSLNIVAISLSNKIETQNVIETMGIPFPVFLDIKGEAQRSFHAYITPSLYFLDGGQRLLKYRYGGQSKKQLHALLLSFAHITSDSTFSIL
jgi:peroxiredoxin